MDCIDGMNKLDDESFDLVIADPPYGISRKLNVRGKRMGTTAVLDFEFGKWDKFNYDWFETAKVKTRGWIITFCAKQDIGFYWDILEKNEFVAVDALVWQKPDPLPLNAKSRFLNAWEAMVVGKRKGAYWGSNYQHNIIKYQAPKGKNRIHPTQKPLDLIKTLVQLTTKKGDLVLDPFMGSGTTAVACKELNRKYIGFEKSKTYVDAARRRVKRTQMTFLND